MQENGEYYLREIAEALCVMRMDPFGFNDDHLEDATHRAREWMSVNGDVWKKRITDELTKYQDLGDEEYFEDETDEDNWDKYPGANPDVIFNNPTFAIALVLKDVLKYLVVEKRVDVNSSVWEDDLFDGRPPLLLAAIRINEETIEYLLTLENVDTSSSVIFESAVSSCWVSASRLQKLMKNSMIF